METNVKAKDWILFGAGDEGEKLALALEGTSIGVYAFCDNDKAKIGMCIHGKPIISFEELKAIHGRYQVVIAVSKKYEREIEEQLKEGDVKGVLSLREAYDEVKFKRIPILEKYKDIHKGKRCFLIGSGPSLRVEDLEILYNRGEITFASNKIFKLYDQTDWRPNYYCVTDYKVIKQYYDEIINISDSEVLIAEIRDSSECRQLDSKRLNKTNINCFRIHYRESMEELTQQILPCFSFDPTRYVVDGGLSVTYAMMQWAVYMGFSEIYLLGIDFFYKDMSGRSNGDHFGSNYMKEGELINPPNLAACKKAYMRAEMLSKQSGFKIYNATRGGKLDVFQRINLEDLFVK